MGSSCCTISYYIKEPQQKQSSCEIPDQSFDKSEEEKVVEQAREELNVVSIHENSLNNSNNQSLNSSSINRSRPSSEATNKRYFTETKLFSELELILEKQEKDKRLPDIFKSIVKDSSMINVINSQEKNAVELFGYLKQRGKFAQKKASLNVNSSAEYSSEDFFEEREEVPP